MEWSGSTIAFNRTDHPAYVPHLGKFALVVDPIVEGFRLTRVLIDVGSGMNIIFPDTPAKMGISQSRLLPSSTGFHGFVPGGRVNTLGQLNLEVVFGDEKNFRSETIRFEVTPFMTGYNAILGWPAYLRFMALPSYAYLQLKMPGPCGTVTIHGSPERALEAEVVNVFADPAETMLPAKPRPGPVFQPAKETKKFQVHPEDLAKTLIIREDLPEEKEAALLQFL